MLLKHFVDLDLRVEIFFRRMGKQEKGSIYFEIGDIDTSAYAMGGGEGVKKKFMYSLYFFRFSFGYKEIAFKRSLDLYFHPLIIELI